MENKEETLFDQFVEMNRMLDMHEEIKEKCLSGEHNMNNLKIQKRDGDNWAVVGKKSGDLYMIGSFQECIGGMIYNPQWYNEEEHRCAMEKILQEEK